MNILIKELAEQAGFKNYDSTSLYSPYIEGIELNDELQEFAKLIIQECISVGKKVEDEYRQDFKTNPWPEDRNIINEGIAVAGMIHRGIARKFGI